MRKTLSKFDDLSKLNLPKLSDLAKLVNFVYFVNVLPATFWIYTLFVQYILIFL